jgi:hypothetical protein
LVVILPPVRDRIFSPKVWLLAEGADGDGTDAAAAVDALPPALGAGRGEDNKDEDDTKEEGGGLLFAFLCRFS